MSKESMIQWMQNRLGKVTYSMTHRLGPNSYDCSSAVFLAMIAGGFLPSGSMGNTETLFGMFGTMRSRLSTLAQDMALAQPLRELFGTDIMLLFQDIWKSKQEHKFLLVYQWKAVKN